MTKLCEKAQKKFQSPCGEEVVKASGGGNGGKSAVWKFQSPCGEEVVKEKCPQNRPNNKSRVSVPLRGRGGERMPRSS